MFPYLNILGRPVSTYGLCAALALVLVTVLAIFYAKKQGLAFENIIVAAAMAIAVGFVSANILHIFVAYPLDVLAVMIQHGDWSFLGSGFVFYGGLIGGLLGAMIGAKIMHRRLSDLEDSVVPYVPLGHAIGRVGCVLVGCCNGVPYDGPLALYYPNSVAGLSPEQGYFPTQLLEALLNCVLFAGLLWYRKKQRGPYQLTMFYLGGYSIIRFFVEYLRGDAIRGVFGGVSTSQWISLALLAGCIICWFLLKRKKK